MRAFRVPCGDKDYFVIHDKVEATDAAFQKSRLSHSMHLPDLQIKVIFCSLPVSILPINILVFFSLMGDPDW